MLRLVFHPLRIRPAIVNWDEVSRHLLARAEQQLGHAGDSDGLALLSELRAYRAGGPGRSPVQAIAPADLLLPVHIRKGDFEVRLFSAIMTLGTPRDVTLQELRVETFFPADEASEMRLRATAPQA